MACKEYIPCSCNNPDCEDYALNKQNIDTVRSILENGVRQKHSVATIREQLGYISSYSSMQEFVDGYLELYEKHILK